MYYEFASSFVDGKENLKNIMQQLGETTNDEKRIKAELFYLLSLFILSFEYRQPKIKNIIIRNKSNFTELITDFELVEQDDEETQGLLTSLKNKLAHIPNDPVI
jgi:predicted DNA binding CopG/RHH family protein